ncbi:TerC family protein [Humisphaera borealis]|uniref:TerC family protein n=1 Tax=Humisphaera borealis TaxID=2807512 RepID=A0A7M2WUD5_9BACT|nr:TerC family protein [Humisphaera borealis]QOV89059.1 TerC family protein [Humisphaera borealis]
MLYLWIGFIAAVLVLVALDLFVFHRKDEVMSIRSALKWSAFWIALALVFNVAIYFMYAGHWLGLGQIKTTLHPNGLNGFEAAALFFTGYVVEQSLSVDNLFVMAVIFGYFAIPPKYQHRVLFWGIIGVLLMRGAMIGIGAALISKFSWILYVFGVFLLYTAYKMLFGGGESDPQNSAILRFARRFFPVTHEFHGHRFAVRESELGAAEDIDEPEDAKTPPAAAGPSDAAPTTAVHHHAKPGSNRWVLTPLALALVVIETTDLIFAVDSIPAIFGITDDPFLVFTSNVFAVLGLRSLFFALAGILEKFEYLKVSLAAVLALVGVKMLANKWLHDIPGINFYMLGLVAVFLTAGIVASIRSDRRKQANASKNPDMSSHPAPASPVKTDPPT